MIERVACVCHKDGDKPGVLNSSEEPRLLTPSYSLRLGAVTTIQALPEPQLIISSITSQPVGSTKEYYHPLARGGELEEGWLEGDLGVGSASSSLASSSSSASALKCRARGGLARRRAWRGLGELKLGELKLGELKLDELKLSELKLDELKLGELKLGEGVTWLCPSSRTLTSLSTERRVHRRETTYYYREGLNSSRQFPLTAALHVAVGDGGGAPQHRPTERRAGTSTRTERSHPTGCYRRCPHNSRYSDAVMPGGQITKSLLALDSCGWPLCTAVALACAIRKRRCCCTST